MATHGTRGDAGIPAAEVEPAASGSAILTPPELHQSQWERLSLLIGDRKSSVLGLAAASTIAAICESGILAIAARTATALVNRSSSLHGSYGPVTLDLSVRTLLLIALGLAVLRLLLQAPISYLPARISGDVQSAMRERLVEAYSFASWELQSQDREGHFQEMMTNQIQQASQGASQATQLIVAFFTFLVLVLSAFALDPLAALAVFLAAVALFAALRPANSLAMRLARRLSHAQLQYAGSVGEANRVTEEVSVFGVAGAQCGRVRGFVVAAREIYVKAQLVQRLVPNIYQSLIYFVLVLGLLVINAANVTGISSLGAVVLLLVRAGTYGQTAQGYWVSLRQSLPFVERLQNAIEVYGRSRSRRGEIAMQRIESLAFDRVTYGYRPGRPVLRDLSFEVTGGETIGVIGPSGAGKSTLVQILLRLREPRSGRFLINGVPAAQTRLDHWHERVAYVPQAPKLIHASVADNVRFLRDFDDAAVERACRLARIHDEIMSWPAGYETVVGPRADAVSGGQQQRICLARALISNPSMLVLDEPTSALDPRSEALIQESLEAVHSELTLFIIAHRMSTLSICNRILVLLDGTRDAFGTLEELTLENDYYRLASGLGPVERQPDVPDLVDDRPAPAAIARGPQADGHGSAARVRRSGVALATRPLVLSLRQSADDVARLTSLDAIIGRPTVLERQARLRLRGLPELDDAVTAVRARIDTDAGVPDDEPLFLLSAGWRSGSTLVQRLVLSAGTHMLWGEPYHHCDLIRRLAESLLPFGEGWPPEEYLYENLDSSEDADLSGRWVANLYPSVSTLLEAHRDAVRRLLAPPPPQQGKRWGLKEVRLSGEHALYLRLLFPRARFIFLVRNPADAYASYRRRPQWYGRWPREQVRTPLAYGRMWSRLAESFLIHGEELGAALVRYEDLAAGGDSLAQLEQVLGAAVDTSVLERTIDGVPESASAHLPDVEARILARTTRTVAARCGYETSWP